jgi:hypothetical protein
VAKDIREDSQRVTVPKQFPEGTPPVTTPHDYSSFIFQQMMEIQKSLGQLIQSVTTLTDENKDQNKTIKGLSHKISIAQGALWVLVGIISASGVFVGFFLNKIWNAAIILLQMKPNP